MSSSDSDSDYTDADYSDSNDQNSELIKKFKALSSSKPEFTVKKYTKMNQDLRNKLNSYKPPSSDASQLENPSRRSERVRDRKEIEDAYSQLQNEFFKGQSEMQKRFQIFWDVLNQVLDRMDTMDERLKKVESHEARILKLEEKSSNEPETRSFAAVVRSKPEDSDRLDKLEYLRSEEERKNRFLHATITHSSINKNSPDLTNHVINFFETTLQMPRRNIDLNLLTKKGHNDNTVIVKFSDKRFKNFMYQAKKQLRLNNSATHQNLFINDDLTPYNYKIYMDLKKYRKSLNRNNDPFRFIYTRDGRVYVKMTTDDPAAKGAAVKNPTFLRGLRSGILDQSPRAPSETSEQQPSTSTS